MIHIHMYEIIGPSQNENYSLLDSLIMDEDTEAQYQISKKGERVSDRSTGNESTLSEVSLEDVADCEIAWEDISLGERIGLGTELTCYFQSLPCLVDIL